MCGLPFSGKTTLAKSFAQRNNFRYIGFDDLWMELEKNDVQFPKDKTEGWSYVRQIAQKRIAESLEVSSSVVYDDTNLKAEHRREWINLARHLQSKPVIVFVDVSQELRDERRKDNLKTQERHGVQEENWANATEQFEMPDSVKEEVEVVSAIDIKSLQNYLNKGQEQDTKYPNGTRVEALVIHNNQMLVMRRKHKGEEYYVLPGGGWEPPETFEEGAVRETLEETTIDVQAVRFVFDLIITNESRKVVYLCNYIKGEPLLGDYNEKEVMKNDQSDIYQPMWLALEDLTKTKLYTLEFRDWFLENYKDGQLPTEVELRQIDISEFRQN